MDLGFLDQGAQRLDAIVRLCPRGFTSVVRAFWRLSFSLAFGRVGTISRYMSRLSAAVAQSVVSFAFSFAFGRLGALSCEAPVLSAVKAALTLPFALNEIDLPVLFYKISDHGPSLFVYWLAAFIVGSRCRRLLVRGIVVLAGSVRMDRTADTGHGTDVHCHHAATFAAVGGRCYQIRI